MDEFIYFGDSVKATELDNGDVKLGGYLIRFGNPNQPDLTGDYFTPDTDFGDAVKSDGWLNHRMPIEHKGKRIRYTEQLPDVKLTKDNIGVFAEIIIGARNEYEKMLADLGLKGFLGWSSGTAPHLIDRKQVGNASEITRWKLGLDASLTPRPAEYRHTNSVIPLKSLYASDNITDPEPQPEPEAEAAQETAPKATAEEAVKTIEPKKESIMDNEPTKVEPVLTPEQAAVIAKQAAEEAVKAYRASEPAINEDKTHVQVVEDPADRPFKSIAEQMQAVQTYETSKGQNEHARIKYLKATGASEGVPSDGGLLLDPTLVSEFIKPIHEEGPFSSKVRRLPVGSNSNYGWINGVDETSRATGSRWGGVRGYRLAEAATKTASRPSFRKIQWELKKYAVVVYSTDELLADASQFSAIVNQACREELSFMVNDDIINGSGLGGPQGFLNSNALITVTRTDANAVLHADIVNMWNRMDPRGRANAEWYINNDVQPQLDKLFFAAGSTGILSPFISYRPDGVMTMYGRPVRVTEFNQTLGTAGDIVLADMSNYLFWEKGGVEAATSIHVQFLTDETAFRFVYRCDGQSALASALTPYKGTTTTSPFVNLLATS
jgi:HK97 family phage major capsid protein